MECSGTVSVVRRVSVPWGLLIAWLDAAAAEMRCNLVLAGSVFNVSLVAMYSYGNNIINVPRFS